MPFQEVMGLLEFIGSVFLTLLPAPYREGKQLRSAAMVSAVVEAVAGIIAFVGRAYNFVNNGEGGVLPDAVAKEMFVVHGGKFVQGNTVAGLAQFWLNPLTIIIVYFTFEGLVRYTAAAGTGDVVGTLPLYILSGLHRLWKKKAHEASLGPLVADRVVSGGEKAGYDLKVYSCRPKLHWNSYMTVEFEGVLYQFFNEEQGPLPRRFIYYLRKQHVGIPAVVIDHYKIDDVFRPEPDKWAGTPTVWEKAFPDWNVPPVVPDEIVRGSARSDYDLKVYSCRRKEDWNAHVTIEFEEQWYRLIRDEKGTASHPFIYYLKKAAETRPAAVIRKYTPEA